MLLNHWSKILRWTKDSSSKFGIVPAHLPRVVGWGVDEIKIQVISKGLAWEMRLSISERSVEQFHRHSQHCECKLHGRASCADGVCKLFQASFYFPILHFKCNHALSVSLFSLSYCLGILSLVPDIFSSCHHLVCHSVDFSLPAAKQLSLHNQNLIKQSFCRIGKLDGTIVDG